MRRTQHNLDRQSPGFSLIEILIAVAILVLLAVVISTGLINFSKRQSLEAIAEDIRIGLMDARRNTLASVDDTTYGVYVGATSTVFFSGESYASGIPVGAVAYTGAQFATSSFTGGTWSVVFDRLTGEPSATGTITIVDSITHASTTITIQATGLIE